MIRKIFFASAIVVAISGCTAMDKLAGMGVVSQQTSTFDNSTVIDVSPNSLYDPNSTWGTQLQLGAIWSSSQPEQVGLIGVSLDIENYCTVSLFFEQTYL